MAVKGKKGRGGGAKKAEVAATVVETAPEQPIEEAAGVVEQKADEEEKPMEVEEDSSAMPENNDAGDENNDAMGENDENNEEQNNQENDEKNGGVDENKPDKESKSSIFIGNAPLNAKEETIKEHFKKYGTIKKVTILQESGLPLNHHGYGRKHHKGQSTIVYVDFETEDEAKGACVENQQIFEEKRLRVNMARERPKTEQKLTVFVGNLSFTAKEEELYDLFAEYGEIDFVRIVPGKGYGFVHFKTEEAVDKSVEKNKTEFCGREIHVEKSRPPIEGADNKRKRNDSGGFRGRGGFGGFRGRGNFGGFRQGPRGGGGGGGRFHPANKRPKIKF